MNLIEQATSRLEQLQGAGINVPWSVTRGPRAVAKDELANAFVDEPRIVTPVVTLVPAPVASPVAEVQAPLPTPPLPPTSLPVRFQPPEPLHFGRVDLDSLRGQGYITPEQDRSAIAEQFKHLKRELLKSTRNAPRVGRARGTALMITSALPGEGKTFCSVNLAMSMAMEIDTSVILIDADVVRPSLFTRLGIAHDGPGLLDLLAGDEVRLADALVATNIPKLTIMSSGKPRGRSTEWLASDSMTDLLARLAIEYPDHVVIFDAPPLLLTSESAALAAKIGQVLVVVEAGKTSTSAVRAAFDMVKQCPTVMPVLNKGEHGSEGSRYGYYYQ